MNAEPAKVTSVALGERLEQEVEIYAHVGPFNGNRSELVRRALADFLSRMPNESRMNAALHAYERHGVTITRAAEIAGVTFEEMFQRLRVEGILDQGDRPEGLVSEEEVSARKKALADRVRKNRAKESA